MRWLRLIASSLVIGLLSGCGPTTEPVVDDDDDDSIDEGPAPAALATSTDGDCPDLSQPGTSTFSSNGIDRPVTIFFPDDAPADLPVVFAWHGLGDNPANFAAALRLESFAQENEAIVVVPQTDPSQMIPMWGFLSGGENDLALYDDLRTCLVEEMGADVRRVYSMGFSAGALWTSFLGMQRGDTLAAIASFSGGADVPPLHEYETPVHQFPALLMWGGPNDIVDGFGINFEDATLALSEELREDGHFVVHCPHTLGHTIPSDGMVIARRWLLGHRYGQESRFLGGDIADIAEWCEFVE